MPTQREASPDEPLGALGRMRVEVASRMKEFEATGPVENAGPIAAWTEVRVVRVRAERACFREGMLVLVVVVQVLLLADVDGLL